MLMWGFHTYVNVHFLIIFMSLSELNWWQLLGSKLSNAQENDSLAVPLMHLELRREHKEGHTKVRESKVEIISQDS